MSSTLERCLILLVPCVRVSAPKSIALGGFCAPDAAKAACRECFVATSTAFGMGPDVCRVAEECRVRGLPCPVTRSAFGMTAPPAAAARAPQASQGSDAENLMSVDEIGDPPKDTMNMYTKEP